MKVRELLNSIEWLCEVSGVKAIDRAHLRVMLRDELREIVGKDDWDWAKVRLDPAIQCVVGVRQYTLPSNFGENFARNADEEGRKPCCKLNDDSSESNLEYISPAQFFGLNLQSEQDSTPSRYTILTVPDTGRRQLWLSPPPDDDYTVGGIYVPNDWEVGDENNVPPVPGNANILKYAILRRIAPQLFNGDYMTAFSDLAKRSAEFRSTRVIPLMSRDY